MPKAKAATILAAVLLTVVAAGLLAQTTTAPSPKATGSQLLAREVSTAALAKMPLMRVLKYYEELSGLTVEADWAALKAVGQYAAEERRYQSWLSRSWPRAFERHSRRFAIENQVCPRCTRKGPFTESAGRCACGFAYGG
jgi:hypothetical protein